MIFGEAAPRFIYATESLDFTPTKYYKMPQKESEYTDKLRNSIITEDRKHIAKGQYLNLTYELYDLTKAQIDTFMACIGKTIDFYPHSDFGSGCKMIVESVKPQMEKDLAFMYYVEIRLKSESYFTYGTRLTVTAPNGSEIYQRNQTVTITWTSNILPASEVLAIELWKNGSKDSDIDTSELNDGSYSWTVAADATAGTDYKVKVMTVDGLIYDLSDADFTITYDGYYLYDGTNDFTVTPITDLGTIWEFECDYYRIHAGVDSILFGGWDDGDNCFRFYLNTIGRMYYKKEMLSEGGMEVATAGLYASLIPQNTWVNLKINVNHTTGVVTFYVNGNPIAIDIPGSETSNEISLTEIDIGKYTTVYSGNARRKNEKLTVDGVVVFDYYCNEADPGAPYTNKTVDWSGNGNHGTPTNITGGTFFNQS